LICPKQIVCILIGSHRQSHTKWSQFGQLSHKAVPILGLHQGCAGSTGWCSWLHVHLSVLKAKLQFGAETVKFLSPCLGCETKSVQELHKAAHLCVPTIRLSMSKGPVRKQNGVQRQMLPSHASPGHCSFVWQILLNGAGTLTTAQLLCVTPRVVHTVQSQSRTLR
jgi:hypothetical protein